MNARILALALALCGFAFAAGARAQCLDWTPGYFLTGIDGEIRAFAVFDDGSGNGPELYAGGNFRAADDVSARNIAKWNGTRWAAVGGGRPGPVQALHVWDDGGGPALWAGSFFSQYGDGIGDVASVLAKWDGNAWTNAASGATVFGGVSALASYDDGSGSSLFVSARFQTITGATLAFPNVVARYDGSQWSQMGAGIYSDFNAANALTVHDDGSGPRLFAGGYHLRPFVNGPTTAVYTWDGASWTSGGAGYLNAGFVRSFAERATGAGTTELYASGYETTSFTDTTLMRWTGASWQSVGGIILGEVWSLLGDSPSSGPGVVYVCGPAFAFGNVTTYGLAVWDGQQYAALSTPVTYPNAPTRLALYDEGAGTRLFTGGLPNMGVAPDARGIARWDGSSWSAVGTGNGYDVSGTLADLAVVNEVSGPTLYAAGELRDGLTTTVPSYGVGRWTGQGFVMTGGSFYLPPSELAAFDDGVHGEQLYAGGTFTSIGGFSMNRVARWDGTYWQPLGAGISLVNTSAASVNDMIAFDDGSGARLIVAGKFDLAGGVPAKCVAAWDGASWSALGTGLDDQVQALAVFDDGTGSALYAAGSFVVSGLEFIARWNGTAWIAVPGVTNGQISALQVHDDGSGPKLYAAGHFWLASSQFAVDFARWDGSAWQTIGAGAQNVTSMTSFDDGSGSGPKLYAAGTFTSMSVTLANGVAAWNGSTWEPLETGIDSVPRNLRVFDDGSPEGPALFACGSFTRAGAYASARIARWARTGACASSTGTPFCFGDGSTGACPCGNAGAIGRGCDNSALSTGARLWAEGQAMISADSVTLRVEGTTPFGAMLFFQGTTQPGGGTGVAFGDGLRCVGGSQYRLAIRSASAGTASFGDAIAGDASVSDAGNLPSSGWATRQYQVWYRDAQSFCTSSTFNLSNGLTIRWAP